MAILEGMSSGLSVLLRDLELYEGILAGNYMEASDVAGFKAQLERMATDKAYLETAKDGAKKRCGVLFGSQTDRIVAGIL